MPPTSQAGRRLRHEGGELGVVGVGGHGQVGVQPRRYLLRLNVLWIWVFAPLGIIGGPSRGVGIYLHTPNRGRAAAGKRYIHTLNRM